MGKDFVQIAEDVIVGIGALRQGSPDTMKAFTALSMAATATHAINTKMKELMALAIGIAKVLSDSGELLCWADRPKNPGWQTDARLACPIPGTGQAQRTFTLRVALRSEGENTCGSLTYAIPSPRGVDRLPAER